ncbi:MAG: hypothetical protein LH609_10965 [Rudanella sp.]|nr:hypothetical protein [Rudanella sp.]
MRTRSGPLFERRIHETYIEEIRFTNKWREMATVRTFTHSGQRITEEHYANYDKGIKHGLTRCWYPNGQTYWSSDFKHGDMNGPLLVYYPDGSTKRREYFRMGVSRENTCFNPDGTTHPCEAFAKAASFLGTEKEFLTALKNKLAQVGFDVRNQDQHVSFQGIIEENGQLTGIIVNPADHELTEPLQKALSDLPHWKPATVDNEPVATHYYQSLLIQGREVYINR